MTSSGISLLKKEGSLLSSDISGVKSDKIVGRTDVKVAFMGKFVRTDA